MYKHLHRLLPRTHTDSNYNHQSTLSYVGNSSASLSTPPFGHAFNISSSSMPSAVPNSTTVIAYSGQWLSQQAA